MSLTYLIIYTAFLTRLQVYFPAIDIVIAREYYRFNTLFDGLTISRI